MRPQLLPRRTPLIPLPLWSRRPGKCKPHVAFAYSFWLDVYVCGKCWQPITIFELILSQDAAALRRKRYTVIKSGTRRR